jgi:arylsulfatase A-like enzyme
MKVIYVMADSLRRDHVSAYGSPPWWQIHTPNLEQFATTAAVFENAYIGSFPTVPNRRDTHLGHGDKGFPFNRWKHLEDDETTFPTLLGEAGIPSMLISDTQNNVTGGRNIQRDYTAWQLNRGQEGDRSWLDDTVKLEYPVPKEYIRYPEDMWHRVLMNRAHRREETDWSAPGTYSMAMRWLEKNYTRDDFFLWIDTFDPHEPWDPPQYYIDRYDPGYTGRVFDAPSYGLRKEMGISDAELTNIRARYAGEVTMVDRWFGRLLDTLDALGIADETAIVFTADHGTNFDGPGDVGFLHKIPHTGADGFTLSAGRPMKKPIRYFPLSQNVCRVPLLVRLPGMSSQKRISAIVQPWDMTATILDLYGRPVPDRMIGNSLLPLIAGSGDAGRAAAVAGTSPRTGTTGGMVQAMDGTWSYTLWRGERGPALHHMIDDPNCERNRAEEEPVVAARLRGEIETFVRRQGFGDEWMNGYTTRGG